MKRIALLVSLALIVVIVAGAFGTSFAYTWSENGKTRVIVEFVPGKKAAVENALQVAGAEFHYSFNELNAFAVTLPAAALNGISRNPNVVSVEEDALRFPINITASEAQAPLAAGSQVVPYGVDMVQARQVWDANFDGNVDAGAPTGSSIKICIIDSGFYIGHEDLQGVSVSGYNGNLPWNQDGSGHGTHVAGTITAVNNALGVIGVTPGTATVYAVRVFGNDGAWAYSSTLIDAANRCASAGAKIISMSLGGSRSNNTEKNGFANLYNQGILSIAAAGNDGNNRHSYPASYDSVVSVAAIDSNKVVADFSQYTSQVELAAPGVGVLSTVPYLDATSLTADNVIYAAGHIEYSARGSASGLLVDGGLCTATNGAWSGKVVLCQRGDISFYDKVMNVQNSGGAAAAIYNNVPGGFLGTLGDGASSAIIGLSLSQEDGQYLVANKLDLSATVSSVYTAPASGYEYYDGTSMATPHVSAVAALVWSSKPTATNQEIRDALAATAEDLGAAGRDVYYGYGLVQAADAIAFLGGGTVDNPPSVNISSPSNGASFTTGATISFSGSANDDFDGNLSSSLVWTSDRDGQIGTGASFNKVLSDGTHTITASSTDSSNNTGSASVTVTVGGGSTGGDLVVSVSTDKSTYVNRDTALITVTVTDGSSPVSGASVTVRISTPKGTIYSGTSTTNANGVVTFSFNINTKKDGSGTYSVEATASASGYNPGSSSTTFQAQ